MPSLRTDECFGTVLPTWVLGWSWAPWAQGPGSWGAGTIWEEKSWSLGRVCCCGEGQSPCEGKQTCFWTNCHFQPGSSPSPQPCPHIPGLCWTLVPPMALALTPAHRSKSWSSLGSSQPSGRYLMSWAGCPVPGWQEGPNPRKGPGGSGEQVLFSSPEQCRCFLFLILNEWAPLGETQAADWGKTFSATAGAREVLPGRTHPVLPYQIKGHDKKLERGTPRCPMALSTWPVSIDWRI